MRNWLLLLLLIPLAQAAPEHEAALLDAQLSVAWPLDLRDPLTAGLGQFAAPPGADGCHDSGTLRTDPDGTWMIFQETKQQNGCLEARLALVLPEPAPTARLSFRSDRHLEQASTAQDQQFVVHALQEVVLYQGSTEISRRPYFDRNDPHQPERIQHDLDLPMELLGTEFDLAWYWEQPGTGAAAGTGTLTGLGFLSQVSDAEVRFSAVPVAFQETRTVNETVDAAEGVRRDMVTSTLDLHPGWFGNGSRELTIELLDTVTVVGMERPDGSTLGPDDWQRLESGGRQTIIIPTDALGTAGGPFELQIQGTVALPPPPTPAPPTRLAGLVYGSIGVVFLGFIGAVAHQGLLIRDGRERQRPTVQRMSAQLVVVGVVLIALTAFILARAVDLMAVFPVVASGIGLYVALAALLFVCLVHISLGALRRGYAKDLARAERIEAANEVLARSNRDLEQFAYVASHDLQEPLRKVASFTSLLERRYKDSLDAKGQGYVDNAHEAAIRARTLIRDLLAFSRIGQDAPVETVDLNDVLADVHEELADDLADVDGRLDISPLPEVPGSPLLLRQLLFNLVSNAIKYRDPERPPHIQVGARTDRGRWRIHVRDNGLGIAPEHQDQVFQIFQRLHGRSSGHDGSGIGLAICQRIAEFHDGRIGVKSTPGVGSEFYVELPMERKP